MEKGDTRVSCGVLVTLFCLVQIVAVAQENPVENKTDAKTDKAAPSQAKLEQEMVSVPAGEFIMGSDDDQDDEKPRRTVYLDAFSIDKTEVTVAAYKACVDAGSCSAPSTTSRFCSGDYATYNNWNTSGRDDYPVNCVDWSQAKTYCNWAGKRLPTEAEWEKAARGTDGREYPWGNGGTQCSVAVMNDGGGKGCGSDRTWPVGSKPSGASPYGALDMAGNVWEWTADWYDAGYYADAPEKNPNGPQSGTERVNRGGGFSSPASDLRASNRVISAPSGTHELLGFRCAR